MQYDEFKVAVRQACTSPGAVRGLVPIPVLRTQLSGRVSDADFDRFLLELQGEGLLHLLTHVDADTLPDEDRTGCLGHPSGALLYWAYWVEGPGE